MSDPQPQETSSSTGGSAVLGAAAEAADNAVPHNEEAEQALLGAILLNNSVMEQVGISFAQSISITPFTVKFSALFKHFSTATKLLTPSPFATFLTKATL